MNEQFKPPLNDDERWLIQNGFEQTPHDCWRWMSKLMACVEGEATYTYVYGSPLDESVQVIHRKGDGLPLAVYVSFEHRLRVGEKIGFRVLRNGYLLGEDAEDAEFYATATELTRAVEATLTRTRAWILPLVRMDNDGRWTVNPEYRERCETITRAMDCEVFTKVMEPAKQKELPPPGQETDPSECNGS